MERLLPQTDAALARDIHYNMRMRERSLPRIFLRSPYLQHRGTIVDMLHKLGDGFGLSDDTIFTALSYYDRFSDNVDIPGGCIGLTALACFLLAAKWEEKEEDAPLLHQLASCTGDNVRDLQLMEMVVLDFLGWNLTTVVPSAYLPYYLRSSMSATDFARIALPSTTTLELTLMEQARTLLSAAAMDYTMVAFAPSVLAASAVVAARSQLGVTPCWAPGLLAASGFAEHDLMGCVQRLLTMPGPKAQMSPVNRHEMAAMAFGGGPGPVPIAWDMRI